MTGKISKKVPIILLLMTLACYGCRNNGGADDIVPPPAPAPGSLLWLEARRGVQPGIYDAKNRQVLLRGANFNHLGDYFQTDPSLPTVAELGADDWDGAAALGENVIRLVTSWSLWEPTRGTFNREYLERVRDAVHAANARGMYVVIDMHQDAWSKYVFTPVDEICPAGTWHQRGWDGAPEWATLTDDQQTCTPGSREQSPAVMRAWENFYANQDGIRDELAWVWGQIAFEFSHDPGVAGYDLLNEPGNGTGSGVGSFIEGLTFFYQSSIAEIRRAEALAGSPGHIIFFEPSVSASLANFDLSTDPNIVFAPHNYFESIVQGTKGLLDISFDLYAALAVFYGDTTLWYGEYGSFGDIETNEAWMTRFAALEDSIPGSGGTWWQWEQECGDPHSVQYPPTPEWLAQQVLSCGNARFIVPLCSDRPYPRAVPGNLVKIGEGACSGHLIVDGTTNVPSTTDLWYPASSDIAPGVTGSGIQGVSLYRVNGGWQIAVDVSGDYRIELTPSQKIPTILEINAGNNQYSLPGTTVSEPLSVKVMDQFGYPMADVPVQFTVTSGIGTLSTEEANTGTDGTAAVSLTVGNDPSDVFVAAQVTGLPYVAFVSHPRWPVLSEVVDTSLNGDSVYDLPVLVADLDTGARAIVVITQPFGDLHFGLMPRAGDLIGATIEGVPADSMTTVLMPAENIATTGALLDPSAGQSAGLMMGWMASDDLPVLTVTGYSLMGQPMILGISGDIATLPAGVTTSPLSDALLADPPSAALPLIVISASQFPETPDPLNSTFMPLSPKSLPIFANNDTVLGAALINSIPSLVSTISTSGVTYAGLENGTASFAPVIADTPSITDIYVPKMDVRQIGLNFVPAAQIYLNKIVPLQEAAAPINDEQSMLMEGIIGVIDDNSAFLAGLLSGASLDMTGILPLILDLLPTLNGLVQNEHSLLFNQYQQLIILTNEVLPAYEAALPPDGQPFGGYSDGIPSTVRDDLLPFVNGELTILIDAFPAIHQLLTDLDAFIPEQADMVVLMYWFFNLDSKLLPVLQDLNALLPSIVEGLTLLNDQGFPILYDIIEELQMRYPPGTLFLRDVGFFKNLLSFVAENYGPDATCADVGILAILAPILGSAGILPPDVDLSILPLADLLNLLGGMDVNTALSLGSTIVGVLQGALPGLINTLAALDFTTIQLPF